MFSDESARIPRWNLAEAGIDIRDKLCTTKFSGFRLQENLHTMEFPMESSYLYEAKQMMRRHGIFDLEVVEERLRRDKDEAANYASRDRVVEQSLCAVLIEKRPIFHMTISSVPLWRPPT